MSMACGCVRVVVVSRASRNPELGVHWFASATAMSWVAGATAMSWVAGATAMRWIAGATAMSWVASVTVMSWVVSTFFINNNIPNSLNL